MQRLILMLFSSLVFSLILPFPTNAEFGIPKKATTTAEVGADGETSTTTQQQQQHDNNGASASSYSKGEEWEIQTANQMLELLPGKLREQQAVDIAHMLYFAKTDPETNLLLRRMKQGSGQEDFQAFASSQTPPEILQNLLRVLADLQATEVLFQDPQRAIREMKKEGMLTPDKVKLYEQNPKLLEEDIRKSLYFSFVSLGAAGGYL